MSHSFPDGRGGLPPALPLLQAGRLHPRVRLRRKEEGCSAAFPQRWCLWPSGPLLVPGGLPFISRRVVPGACGSRLLEGVWDLTQPVPWPLSPPPGGLCGTPGRGPTWSLCGAGVSPRGQPRVTRRGGPLCGLSGPHVGCRETARGRATCCERSWARDAGRWGCQRPMLPSPGPGQAARGPAPSSAGSRQAVAARGSRPPGWTTVGMSGSPVGGGPWPLSGPRALGRCP